MLPRIRVRVGRNPPPMGPPALSKRTAISSPSTVFIRYPTGSKSLMRPPIDSFQGRIPDPRTLEPKRPQILSSHLTLPHLTYIRAYLPTTSTSSFTIKFPSSHVALRGRQQLVGRAALGSTACSVSKGASTEFIHASSSGSGTTTQTWKWTLRTCLWYRTSTYTTVFILGFLQVTVRDAATTSPSAFLACMLCTPILHFTLHAVTAHRINHSTKTQLSRTQHTLQVSPYS